VGGASSAADAPVSPPRVPAVNSIGPISSADDQLAPVRDALGDATVTLDVGGVTFRTRYSTLARWPGTRLCQLAVQHAVRPAAAASSSAPTAAAAGSQQLFFDRDPDVFSSVLDYYRTGLLQHRNTTYLVTLICC